MFSLPPYYGIRKGTVQVFWTYLTKQIIGTRDECIKCLKCLKDKTLKQVPSHLDAVPNNTSHHFSPTPKLFERFGQGVQWCKRVAMSVLNLIWGNIGNCTVERSRGSPCGCPASRAKLLPLAPVSPMDGCYNYLASQIIPSHQQYILPSSSWWWFVFAAFKGLLCLFQYMCVYFQFNWILIKHWG